jgi:threonine/homoserine/homoserine lactone efflux protein
MTIEHLIAFNIALFAAIASPGPALLVAIQTTLSSGRTAGMSIEAVSKVYLRAKVHIDRVAAVVLGALGVRLAFQER